MPEDKKACYAAALVKRYAGLPGWPKSFGEPIYKPHVMEQALRWKDLTGTKRPDKPWLDGMPRVIFLNDMSDGFTPSAPQLPPTAIGGIDWMSRHWMTDWLSKMGKSPHIWLLLTKQGKRMRMFFDEFECPSNVWTGVSVIDNAMAQRNLPELMATGAKTKWISYEPARDLVNLTPFIGHNAYRCKCGWHETEREMTMSGHDPKTQSPKQALCAKCGKEASVHLAASWVVIGGESRQGKCEPHPFDVTWMRRTIQGCREAAVPCFSKQLGSHVIDRNDAGFEGDQGQWPAGTEVRPTDDNGYQGAPVRVMLKDSHGGDWNAWPEDLKIRQMPKP